MREYWIVTPWPPLVEVLRLDRGQYVVDGVYGKTQTLASPAFPGLRIRLRQIFGFPPEPDDGPPVVRETPPAYRTRKRKP